MYLPLLCTCFAAGLSSAFVHTYSFTHVQYCSRTLWVFPMFSQDSDFEIPVPYLSLDSESVQNKPDHFSISILMFMNLASACSLALTLGLALACSFAIAMICLI